MGRTADIVAACVIAAAALFVNAHTLDYGFVYDDRAVILERPAAWDQGWSDFLADRPWGLGRHLTALSLDLDRDGADAPSARPFHRTNTVLSALVGILVYVLARSLGIGILGSFAAAALFTVHPLHVDAVVSIVGRAELLAALFVLSALLLHIHGYPPLGLSLLAASLLFLAGLASKESAACLPLLAFGYDVLHGHEEIDGLRRRPAFGVYLSYVLSLAAWLMFVGSRYAAGDEIEFVDNPLAFVPAWDRVLLASEILWRYVGLLVWPVDLKADRSFAETQAALGTGALGLAAWVMLAAVAIWQRKQRPALAFALAWFGLAFAATANIARPIGTIMAERLAYLPSVGPCLLVGMAIGRLCERGRVLRVTVVGATALVCLVLAFAYHGRSIVWSEDLHFHTQTAVDAPRSAKAHYNLGLALARNHQPEDAVESFRRAIDIYPPFYLAVEYATRALRESGRMGEAASLYADYIVQVPEDRRAMASQADLLRKLGRFSQARQVVERLLELEPGDAGYIDLLSRIESGERAAAAYKRANP